MNLTAQVSGTVFLDYNGNGIKDNNATFNEIGFEGMTITAYASDGTVINSAMTASDGTYTIAGVASNARIEFTWTEAWLEPSVAGGTTVQFVTGVTSNVDLGVVYPREYCPTDANLAMPCYVNGNPRGGGTAGPLDAWIQFEYTNSGDNDGTDDHLANAYQVGTLWGVAFQSSTGLLFSSAVVRRHAGLGTIDGTNTTTGGIYMVDAINGTTVDTTWLDVNDFAGVDTGMDPRVEEGSVLPPNGDDASRDILAYSVVGRRGLGDLEISDNEDTLYVVNLFQKTILVIDIASQTLVRQVNITDPGCNNGESMPFGLGYYKGELYVGSICNAISTTYSGSTGSTYSDLHAYVRKVSGTSLTPVFDFPLDFVRAGTPWYAIPGATTTWQPWVDDWTTLTARWSEFARVISYPQPMLSDIEFDIDGSMILAFSDRLGLQTGFLNYAALPTGNTLYEGLGTGDIIRVCNNAGTFELEGSIGCTTAGSANGEGPSGGEYYYQDWYPAATTNHEEIGWGSLAICPGTDEIAMTGFDPHDNIRSGGVHWLSNSMGTHVDGYEVFGDAITDGAHLFSKATGLGDVELTHTPAPVEIGNLVWSDTDGDGVQDAGEAGISGVQVELYDPNTTSIVGTATTDGNGNYLFSTGAGTSTAAFVYNLSLTYGANYEVRISNAEGGSQQAAVSGLGVTAPNNDGSANGDIRDSDGSQGTTSSIPFALGKPGENNHTYDFGFAMPCEIIFSSVSTANCTDNGSNNFTFDLSVEVTFSGAPAGEDIQITLDGGMMQTITSGTASPQTISFNGLTADGSSGHTLLAQFATTTSCNASTTLKYPEPCPNDVTISCPPAATEIEGTVWEDWNTNGQMDESSIIGVEGVQVTLTDDCGATTQTTYTDSDGQFEFTGLTGGTPYRVEYTLPEAVACRLCPAHSGSDNGTTVQFVQPGNCANLALINPTDYCQSNPYIFTPCYVNGDPNLGGTAGSMEVLVRVPYNSSGFGSNEYIADGVDIGSTYGLAYQRESNSLFASAYFKRHVGLKDQLGSIFLISNPTGAFSSSAYFDLEDLGVDVGTIPVRDLDALATEPNRDEPAFSLVGKIGLGDIELSPDGADMFTINLFDKKLYKINIGVPAKSGGSITAGDITDYSIPSPNCSMGEWRPFALGFVRGRLLVGGVCTAENGGGTSDLHAYIYEFDITSNTFSGTPVLDFALDFPRGEVNSNNPGVCAGWFSWSDDLADFTNFETNKYCRPQPMFVDIQEDIDGSIILGFRDRAGDQLGHDNYVPGSSISLFRAQANGDIYRAYNNNGTYVLENNAVAGPLTGCGANNNDGPGNGEFYCEDDYIFHANTTLGGLALIKGVGEVVNSSMDPNDLDSGGLRWLSNSTGTQTDAYEVYESSNASTFGKANGLGDVELGCNAAPLEIGNYVWLDTDSDGIQDACETGLDGVTVQLYDRNCMQVAETTTANGGQYYFNESNVDTIDYAGTPAAGFTGLSPNTSYYIVVGSGQYASGMLTVSATDYSLTTTDAGASDQIDSDGTEAVPCGALASLPFKQITTERAGCSNHTYDFGFATITLMSCTSGILDNPGFEDPGAATFSTTFEGSPAEALPRNSTTIPGWTMDYSCPAPPGACPDGYWINDTANNLNNPEGNYFIWFPGSAYCAKQNIGTLVEGECIEISFNAASWSNPSPQTDAQFVLEVDPPGANNTSVVSSLLLPASVSWSNLNWQSGTFTYTAPTSGNYELLFSQVGNSFNPTIDKNGVAIDDLCITSVSCPPCSLTDAGETLETCNANSTNSDASDDYITFSLNPTGTNLGASYSVTADNGGTVTLAGGGAATGVSYGSATAFRLQNGSADGATTYTITVTDVSGAPCQVTTTVMQGSCSGACSLTDGGETLETCNDNSTNSDPSDDYITFSLNPTGTNLGASYSVTVDNGGTVTLAGGGAATGVSYGSATAFRLQNGSADGATTYTITVTDVSGAPCQVTTTVMQGSCSGACSLTDAGETLETCNDNSTNSDASDDYITFSLNPTGLNLGASYSVTVDNGGTVTLAGGGAATGVSYGSATAFRLQNGSADGATTYTITVTDVSGAPCQVTTTVMQGSCSASCSLTDAGETLESCNNNSTDSDASDDYITFSLNPVGINLGASYSVTVDNGGTVTLAGGGAATGVSYGSATAFRLQNGSADGATTYTITVTDVSGAPCQVTTTVMQNSCSNCPTITNPTAAQTICEGQTITTLQVNTIVIAPDQIEFVYFTNPQAGNAMYTGGTTLGTVSPVAGVASISNVGFPSVGTYYVYAIVNPTPADAGCRPFQEIQVTVNPLPNNSLTVSDTTVCDQTDVEIRVYSSEIGISYQLRNNSDDSPLGAAQIGNGSTLTFTISSITPNGNYIYNVLATNTTTSCSAELTDMAMVTVTTCDFQTPLPTCDTVPCHFIDPNIHLGTMNLVNDGIAFPNNIRPNIDIQLPITIFNNTGNPAFLRGWIDWNGDNDFEDANEQIILTGYPPGSMTVSVTVSVPGDVNRTVPIAARFRVSTSPTLINSPCGTSTCAVDGEVEDYLIQVECPPEICLPVEIQINRGQ